MHTVRDNKKVWPTCSVCGCRLKAQKHSEEHISFSHFEGYFYDEDARGCRCKMINKSFVAHESRVYPHIDLSVG